LNILEEQHIAGNVYIQRAGEGEAGLVSKGGITLSGAVGRSLERQFHRDQP
jgi:hypothetical protein